MKFTSGLRNLESAYTGDAGLDLVANEDYRLRPGSRTVISTGLAIELPRSTLGLVVSRSGLASDAGVVVLNSPGIVDSGYRSEVKVILHNTGSEEFIIRTGDRIAQLIILKRVKVRLVRVQELSSSQRGHRGFGSTG